MLKKIYYRIRENLSSPEERGERSSGYWQGEIRKEVLSLCRQSKGKIMEVGCGEGLFLSKLAELNRDSEFFAIDICKEMLLKAKRRLQEEKTKSVNLIQADALHLPYKNSAFDTVICINVFYNLACEDNLLETLKEIARVCKEGGRIIFDIRNRNSPLLYLKFKLAKYYDKTINNLPLRTDRLDRINSHLEKGNLHIFRRINVGFPKNNFSPIVVIEAQKR